MELADDSDDRRIIFDFFNSIEWNDSFNQNIIKKYFIGDIKKFKKL